MHKVAVGGGNHPHIRLEHLGGAHADELAGLKDPEQLGLGGERQLANLVEEEGASVCLFEIALPGIDGARKGTLLVAEELGIYGAFGNGPAVHGEIFPVAAGTVLMYYARNHILAGSAFTEYEHGEVVGRGHGNRHAEGAVQGGIIADYIVLVFKCVEFSFIHNACKVMIFAEFNILQPDILKICLYLHTYVIFPPWE